jgi:N-acetylglucosaminyl-diphospho-decaprenol L-rhamnosyltransferase
MSILDAIDAPQAPQAMVATSILKPPRVSVLIATYNSRKHSQRCFAALVVQTMADFEVVVVDNDSADGGPEMPSDRRFRLIKAGRNLGFAAANNLGATLATADWLATLNPDAFPEHDWLEQLLEATELAPNATMVGSLQLADEHPDLLDGAGDCYHPFGVAWRGLYRRPHTDAPPTGEVFGPCAAAALYDRAAFLATGGFDADFFCYHEDVDLAFRLRLAGGRCVQSATARVRHIGSAIAGTESNFSVYHGFRNRMWTLVKNMPTSALFLVAPGHAVATLLLLLRSFVKGTGPAAWRGIADGLAGLPVQFRKRKLIQRDRVASSSALLGACTWSITRLLRREHDVRALS